ncbi:MAG: DNA repair protein RecO [Clostridia bacterium]|nr:DNA repair protein RecO [Clostridia bacterium]
MFTTKAIVVDYTNYRDYDRMVTLISPEMGVINAVARGCRRPKSQLLNATERFTVGEFVIFENKERLSIAQCAISESFYPLRTDWDRLAAGCYYIHALNQFSVAGQPCQEVFELTLKALAFLSYSSLPPALVTLGFELHMMTELGMRPLADRCAICSREFTRENGRFDERLGGAVCLNCPCMGHSLSHGARRILMKVPVTKFEAIELLQNREEWLEAAGHSRRFVEYRLDQPPKIWPKIDRER